MLIKGKETLHNRKRLRILYLTNENGTQDDDSSGLVRGSLKQEDHELKARLNNLERLYHKQASKRMNE